MWHLDALDLKPETSHLKPCLTQKTRGSGIATPAPSPKGKIYWYTGTF